MPISGVVVEVYVITYEPGNWHLCKLRLMPDEGDMFHYTSYFYGRPQVGQRFTMMGPAPEGSNVIQGTARPMPRQLGGGEDGNDPCADRAVEGGPGTGVSGDPTPDSA